jgi:L-galactose dehydrogenase/L-glyceraldehyde 3-phosphate reductase
MQYRTLGKTGVKISVLSFGAGPVSTLMVGDWNERQGVVIQHAVEQGINWFDTSAGYGAGESESNLGRAIEELKIADRLHVATKVRLMPNELGDVRGAVRRSVEGSLQRLRLSRVTMVQLHNAVTQRRADEPNSLTPDDVLGPGGVADAFQELRDEGLISHCGITGLGCPAALSEVIRSGPFETMQTAYHLLNPSAGQHMPSEFGETNHGNVIATAAKAGMGVLAIRVLAGGALANNPPSPHTLKTPYFPFDLYQRDLDRAAGIRKAFGPTRSWPQEAVRFALRHPSIHSALIGFAEIGQIDEAVGALAPDPSPLVWDDVIARVSRQ